LDFAFAGEQRHGAHLAQIHADGIVGLVERARREIELEFLRPFSRAVDRLVVPHVLLVGVDDFDASAAKCVEQIVELVGGRNLRWQQLVDLVVQQVAFFLANVDQLPYFVVLFFNRHLCSPHYVSSSIWSPKSFFFRSSASISFTYWARPKSWSRSISR